VTRATKRGENHQPWSASAPSLGDSPEREPWKLAQNQPGQVNTLSKENNLDQSNEFEGAPGGDNLPLRPPNGRSPILKAPGEKLRGCRAAGAEVDGALGAEQ